MHPLQRLQLEPLRRLTGTLERLVEGRLWLKVLIGMGVGVPTGLALLLVIVMAVAASVGSPATRGAGIVILAVVLAGVGIPSAGLALLPGVDRVLDMSRTAVNVAGDLTACVLLDRWTGDEAAPAVAPAGGTSP